MVRVGQGPGAPPAEHPHATAICRGSAWHHLPNTAVSDCHPPCNDQCLISETQVKELAGILGIHSFYP